MKKTDLEILTEQRDKMVSTLWIFWIDMLIAFLLLLVEVTFSPVATLIPASLFFLIMALVYWRKYNFVDKLVKKEEAIQKQIRENEERRRKQDRDKEKWLNRS